jgi:hypothetical protein
VDPRLKRFAKLAAVHRQLRSLHETRRAAFLDAAGAAEAEAQALARRFDETDSLSGLFPELYHARIAAAWTRAAEQKGLAEAEARVLAELSLREKRIGEERRALRGVLERKAGEAAALDWVETRGFRRV